MEIDKAYEILGVSVTTPKSEIKKIYLKLAKQYHPDVASPEFLSNSKINISMINEAYSCVLDSFNKTNKFITTDSNFDYTSYSSNTEIHNLFDLSGDGDLGFDIFNDDVDDLLK